MIDETREQIKGHTAKPAADKDADKGLDLQWLGTRLEVELPQSTSTSHQKNIVPELINQRFMWLDDYFHYSDWEKAQREVFDSFNLLVAPRKEGEFKYYYDRGTRQRIVPQGIFPPPNHKRVVLDPAVNKYASELLERTKDGNDALHLFEKDPYKMMVLKEQ